MEVYGDCFTNQQSIAELCLEFLDRRLTGEGLEKNDSPTI
jgi:hypothetical protein